MIKINPLFFLLFLLAPVCLIKPAYAQDESFTYIRAADVTAGDYQLSAPDNQVTLKIFQQATSGPQNFKFMSFLKAPQIGGSYTYDQGIQPGSDLYYINFPHYQSGNFSRPPQISLKLTPGSAIRGIYYYDWGALQFQKLTTTIDVSSSLISFDWPDQTELMFALFRDPELAGQASWYTHPKYRKDLIAASVDFPFNTKLRVINVSNNKEVIVTVKDYGPDRNIHPDRVIDLSKPAFKALAPLAAGVINVKVVKVE